MPSEDMQSMQSFSAKFHELEANFQEMVGDLGYLQASLRVVKGKIYANPTPVSRHRIKGLLVDYRLFHHPDPKKTELLKISGIISRLCAHSFVLDELNRQSDAWKTPQIPMTGWHNEFSVSDVIETAFNTKIFHSDDLPRFSDKNKDALLSSFDQNALYWGLMLIVMARLNCLGAVNWMIAPILRGQNALQMRN